MADLDLWPPRAYKIDGCAIIGAEVVPTVYPARRCGAPGCGDKIKGDGETVRLRLSCTTNDRFVFVHRFCFDEDTCSVFDWVGA